MSDDPVETDAESEQIPPSVLKALRSSGFPFQTAVAMRILSGGRFRMLSSSWVEYPWRRESEEHFLDLIAVRPEPRIYAVIECKKTQAEWTFLRPEGGLGDSGDMVRRFRCVYSEQVKGLTSSYCHEFDTAPESIESSYCIVSGNMAGKPRLLERDARLLALGTEDFALDQQSRPSAIPGLEVLPTYVPVIVTTASLYSARFDPRTVDRVTGELAPDPKDIRAERWVRFRKAFTGGPLSLGEQSIYVVQATEVEDFFGGLSRSPYPVRPEGERTLVPRREQRPSY